MKKTYTSPSVVEYGTIGQMTMGSGGAKPDQVLDNGQLVVVNDNCDASPPATSCLVVGS